MAELDIDKVICVINNLYIFLGMRFNTNLGQHILKNPLIITSMIDKVT